LAGNEQVDKVKIRLKIPSALTEIIDNIEDKTNE
jgi:hypothetical protein